MRLVLLGCPGAGKGTQARILCGQFGLAHIATGDLLRAEIDKKTDVGLQVADYLRKGMLVPDDVVIQLAAKKLDESKAGWLLDGFPRTLEQAHALDAYLRKASQKIDLVVYLSMREGEVVSRLTSRRSCSKCGQVFNVATRPPKVEGKCDACGADLVQREDDSEATVRKRLMVYEDLTQPLVAYYRNEHEFQQVEGARPAEQVTAEIAGLIEAARNGKH